MNENLDLFCDKFLTNGLILNLAKCDFYKDEVKCLGLTVDSEGFAIRQSLVKNLFKLKVYSTKNELKQ